MTQTGLYSLIRRLEDRNFRFKKKMDYTTYVVKTKTLISCAVTAQLICVFDVSHVCKPTLSQMILVLLIVKWDTNLKVTWRLQNIY